MEITDQDRPTGTNRWRILGWGSAAALILLPLVAMQFTSEVKWSPADFVFAILIIGGTGLVLELAIRTHANTSYRAGVAAALAGAFLTIWVNGAVGIVGNEDNPINAIFYLIPVIALAGCVMAMFRPRGMFLAMSAAALAQLGALLFVFVATGELILAISAFFGAFWVTSAALFRRASAEEPTPR